MLTHSVMGGIRVDNSFFSFRHSYSLEDTKPWRKAQKLKGMVFRYIWCADFKVAIPRDHLKNIFCSISKVTPQHLFSMFRGLCQVLSYIIDRMVGAFCFRFIRMAYLSLPSAEGCFFSGLKNDVFKF